MTHQSRHEQDVTLAVADNLVGDVHAVAFDVVRLRRCAVVSAWLPSAPVFERRVLSEDPRLELAQLGPRLDPELVHERGPQLAECAQRVGLAPGTVERQEPLMPEPLAQRVVRGQRLELRDRLLVSAAGQQRIHLRLERAEAFLLQPRLLRAGELHAVDVGQRRPAPQRQRLVEDPNGSFRIPASQRVTSIGGELLESQSVELAGRDAQYIPGRASLQAVSLPNRAKGLAQLREPDLKVGSGPVGSKLRP